MNRTNDLIVFSHLRWTFVWQRPQHLISRLARGYRRTWFIEEPVVADVEEPRLGSEDHGVVTRVWLEIPRVEAPFGITFGTAEAARYLPLLQELLKDVEDPTVWLYTPMALGMAEVFEPKLLVYDVMDDLSSFAGAAEALQLRQHQAVAAADVVFAGGRSLFNKVQRQNPARAYMFSSGVDPEHYAAARGHREPRERPVAGYVGVVDERLDLDLLSQLADLLPDWNLQIVGPVIKIDPATLPSQRNITYPGQKPYDSLPEVMGGFDVALMPFALNEATRSISPTKTLEYLAAGLPVVSTPVPDVLSEYGSVVDLQDDAAGFAAACRDVYRHSLQERDQKLRPLLDRHRWDAIAQRMSELMDEALAAKLGETPPTSAMRRQRAFDFLIVGAGYAGSVLAERLATQDGRRVLIVDKRPHIGGNAYDHYDESGVLVHKYGPHIFHTNSREVFDYLSMFTEWRQYEHRVLASVDGRLVPIPINLDTINEIYGLSLSSLEVEKFFESMAEPVAHCETSEDVVVSKVGRDLYEKFFRNYTRKQWDLDPSELDASVTARVPTRTNRDDRYFTDKYQAMPLHGYTRMFEKMLDHPNIKIMINTDYREIVDIVPFEEMIYTGPVDEYFGYRYGKLPYRSLDFKFETHPKPLVQPAPVINYPNQQAYTRVTEFKYLTGQEHAHSTLVYEYPQADGDPYYPVPRPENADLYKRYKALADATDNVHFVGRLATYKYYNMDQVTAQALALHRRLSKRPGHGRSSQPRVLKASTAR
ncbi:MAG: UDP-galactopyranose mutase [Actinomycetota bacterium]|nr:UDP-galactopyranose mutase [Actinomycetota bacterium]